MLETAARAEAVNGCGAHAEQLGHLANRKQGLAGTPGVKMLGAQRLDPIWTQLAGKWCQIVPKVGAGRLRDLQ